MESMKNPAKEIAETIHRLFASEMTTSSGGNVSILDNTGSIWITPSGKDKSSLSTEDICCILPDGTSKNGLKPSIELPFHLNIYRTRPDIRAIVHAHPPAMVGLSINRLKPDPDEFPALRTLIGRFAFSDYAMPGSLELGNLLSEAFSTGADTVIMQSHGAVTGSSDITTAYARFEAAEFLSCISVLTGNAGIANDNFLTEFDLRDEDAVSISPMQHSAMHELPLFDEQVQQLLQIRERAIKRKLMLSGMCAIGYRNISGKLIYLESSPIGSVVETRAYQLDKQDGQSLPIALQALAACKHAQAVMVAPLMHVAAWMDISDIPISYAIPESRMLLGEVSVLPMHQLNDLEKHLQTADCIILSNKLFLVTGKSLNHCLEKLEVAEYSAKALLAAARTGSVIPLSPQQINDLDRQFRA